MPPSPPSDRQGFQIGIICALTLEADAVHDAFDLFWEDKGYNYGSTPGDHNSYTTGVIGEYNVVLAYADKGSVSAASIAASLKLSFPGVHLALVVGICGGVPTSSHHEHYISLGDLVVSTSIIQYDFGRQHAATFEKDDTLEYVPGRLNQKIRGLMSKLKTRRYRRILEDDVELHLQEMRKVHPRSGYPGIEFDHLFKPNYTHKHRSHSDGPDCGMCSTDDNATCAVALRMTCSQLGCEERMRIYRSPSKPDLFQSLRPTVHFGRIGSANTVMRSGDHRDQLAMRHQLIAFEMEGAGVWDYIPSLIIKGVSDYADSHKGDRWQPHAAAVAAAGMKGFLKQWSRAENLYELSPGRSPSLSISKIQATGTSAIETDKSSQTPSTDISPVETRKPSQTSTEQSTRLELPYRSGSRSRYTAGSLTFLGQQFTPLEEHSDLLARFRSQRQVPAIFTVQDSGSTLPSNPDLDLELLRNPDQATVDVVFIQVNHGEWCDQESKRLWPKANDFWNSTSMHQARVWMLMCPSNRCDVIELCIALYKRLHSQTQLNSRQMPIIFVAHGLGGVLLKGIMNIERSAFLGAHTDETFWPNISGALLFCVPHRSEWLKENSKTIQKSSIPFGPVLDRLTELMLLAEDTTIWQTMNVTSIWEKYPTKGNSLLGEESCILNIPTERVAALEKDFINICQYANPYTSSFEDVGEQLDILIEGALTRDAFSIEYLGKSALRDSPWRYLTLRGFYKYYKIWQLIRGIYGDCISLQELDSFFKLQSFFPDPSPSSDVIESKWNVIIRLWPGLSRPRDAVGTKLPESFVMGLIHMLHVHKHFPHETLFKDFDYNESYISTSRALRDWESLRRMNKWVSCACRKVLKHECNIIWNFTNEDGISRQRPGTDPAPAMKCAAVRFSRSLSLTSNGKQQGKEIMEMNKKAFLGQEELQNPVFLLRE